MEMISDILLVAGALGAAFYCFILARRLARFNDLENGVGGAVAVLSAQVDDLTRTLKAAQGAAGEANDSLGQLTERAEGVAKRLELLVASMHDLPDPNANPQRGPETEAGPASMLHRTTTPQLSEAAPHSEQPVFSRRSASS
ncbi:hypothetical protein [Pseudooceanicola sediminis]|uniref:hypothetical protein n=1 Tax=Pseudooceanicola sediminis TaxID=2211117 RepID=UPI001F48CEEE|nr:hypothetical protein [Pseudooceanicola sediminis]|tara:strand:+ start:3867 stop:4292 length:426 start_codon:yes stop_codon:yes gene_type:complete